MNWQNNLYFSILSIGLHWKLKSTEQLDSNLLKEWSDYLMEQFEIKKAVREDLQEILALQYLAYQSEADLFGTQDIPPLKQTLEEIIEEEYRYELFTSTLSKDNLNLYENMGYAEYRRVQVNEMLTFVYLEKNCQVPVWRGN